jgi:predicted flap endonuclease-1-like 5' DNA nuclease
MDWWLILLIFIVLVIIIWWALSRQTEGEDASPPHEDTAAAPDDLTKIEGIGPKVQQLLNQAGITTFSELASRAPDQLDEILDVAGSIYKAMEKGSWPKQAALAADGKWEELQKLQDELIGGR